MLGDRIRYFRELRGFTVEHLGILLGFRPSQAHTRITQMERGDRKPQEPTVLALAEILEISPAALYAPGNASEAELMQTLFSVEDRREVIVSEQGAFINLRLRRTPALETWARQQLRSREGDMSLEEYEHWRHNYLPHDEL